MSETILQVIEKYPLITAFIEDKTGPPALIKLLTTITLLRKKIGYSIEDDPMFDVNKINVNLFDNIEKIELLEILKYFVLITCLYVNDKDFVDIVDKKKICSAVLQYIE
jgi:hypothetical protein